MDETKFIKQFSEDLLILGVRSGGNLLVHPALRPFGHVPGGPHTIIKGLLSTIGSEGTLLMPALSWENVTPQNPVFDLENTPSCVGLIAETFRLNLDSIRSIHPTHSVCAVGPNAHKLLQDHWLDDTPCGPNSPFHKLQEVKSQILMLACDLHYNTSMHAIEELVEPPYLFDPPIFYTITDKDKNTYKKRYRPHNFRGWRQRYDRVENFLFKPHLRSGLVVGVNSYLIDVRKLWKESRRILHASPLYFIDRV